MHVKLMLVWMAYATTMLCCLSSAETDSMDACESTDVRLVGALGGHSGLLEVRCDHDEQWSTVKWCDYNSSDAIASVVCRQMGYSHFNATAEPSSEGCKRSAQQHFLCEGTEPELVVCNFSQSCQGDERVLQVHCQPHATTSDSGANCNAVGGTLGTLVIVLVLLLSGAVAALVYFLKKEFKFNCKLRLQAAKSPRAQPETPEQRRHPEVPDEHILHNPVYAAGAVGAHTRSTDAVTPCQYSVLGPENVDSDTARPNQRGKFRYTN